MAHVGRWQLHPLHLYLVRSYLELDDLTLPLEGPAYGRTKQQLGEVAQREASTMAELGILVNNEVDPSLAQALKVLTKPYLWVDSLWFPDFASDAAWRTVAALTEGDRVVLGVQGPGETDRFGGPLAVEVHEKMQLSQSGSADAAARSAGQPPRGSGSGQLPKTGPAGGGDSGQHDANGDAVAR